MAERIGLCEMEGGPLAHRRAERAAPAAAMAAVRIGCGLDHRSANLIETREHSVQETLMQREEPLTRLGKEGQPPITTK